MPRFKALISFMFVPIGAFAMPEHTFEHTCDQAARYAAAVENVPLDVLRAITRVETGRVTEGQLQPWPWAINAEGKGVWFSSMHEAKAYVYKIFKAGTRSFDIGCFQINYRWHGKAFRSIDAMFDPQENAVYAARFLRQLYAELGSWPAAAGAYHSRTPNLADDYSGRFETVLAQLNHAPPASASPSAPDPFTRTANPLFVSEQGGSSHVLGSLVPVSGGATAFIPFKQE